MYYLDASALVATFAPETKSADVLTLLATVEDRCVISAWTCTEALSAFALKARVGVFSIAQAAQAATNMQTAVKDEFEFVAVSDADIRAAGGFLTPGGPALRASDALHLAIGSRIGAETLTLDVAMARAAAHFGLRCRLL